MKILIADDEQYIRSSLTEDIDWSSYGFQIIGVASTGREAFEMIQQRKPDILLSDILMPDLTGIELLKELRNDGYQIPVVFLSGWSNFEYAREALKFGATNYLLKPCPDEEIIEALLEIKQQKQNQESNLFEDKVEIHSNKHAIKLACEYIHEDLGNGSTLTLIAEKINMNPSAFSRLFHQEMGCSFKRYVTTARINRAKRLLLESNMKIQDLAEHLGYVSTSHFVQVFSKYTGLTPGKFRESNIS
ncbi:response regulator transcription factor [Bacillus massilinigeriensis]|uniref:response regulator transcription factor n=1 Tax=Bacillus massilionigeriensis TaxID=1805475 RepID=UPI00096B2386|nr:response regulator [Bacillus massilionigeriensis]